MIAEEGSLLPFFLLIFSVRLVLKPNSNISLSSILEESIYKGFFISSTEGLAVIDKSGRIEMVNESMCRIFGYDEDELVGMVVHKLVPLRHRDNHPKQHDSYYHSPKSRAMGGNMALFGLRKDGTEVPVEISLSPVKADGEQKVNVMVSDITERIAVQKEIHELNEHLQDKVDAQTADLRNSQELLMLIAKNFPNGSINVFDRELKYVFTDGQELVHLGIDGKKLIGTEYLSRLSDDIRESLEPKLREVFSGTGFQFELEHKAEVYELMAVPLNQGKGEIEQILMVERNITVEKNATREMEKALSRERQLNELKSRFVSMASHEFRTPLTTINSSATLITKYEDSEGQVKRLKHVGRIKSSISHLTNILNDILSLSKLEEGRIEANSVIVELGPFFDDLQEQMDLVSNGKVDLQINHQGADKITIDPNLIRNILVNLISNAIKYSYADGIVKIESRGTDNNLEVSVIDNGIGIPLSEQKDLFDRFFRASNVTNIEGTGLGLNIVLRFVQLMNGEITFESIPEEETKFTIKIPV